jgi:hypothetical protein
MPNTRGNQGVDISEAVRDLRLAEQEILAESLREKNKKIHQLEAQVRFLKDLLVQVQVTPRPQAQPSFRRAEVPRRWRIKT